MGNRAFRTTWLVTRREIVQRGRTRVFIISTLILLIAVALGVALPAILSRGGKPERIAIVGGNTATLTAIVTEAGRLAGVKTVAVPEPDVAAAEAGLRSGELSAALVSDTEVLVKQVPLGGTSGVLGTLSQLAGLSKLVETVPGAAAVVSNGVALPVRGLEPPSTSLSSRLTGLFTVVLVWVMISVHGSALGIVIAGGVFVVLGYAFYCTLFAAAGSLVSRQSDVNSTVGPVQIPLVIGYALSYTVIYANGANTFYRVLGFLPPTSPIAMPVLYAAGDVPVWQVVLSAVLCAASTVWTARLYSQSILRTGPRIRLVQALRRGTARV